MQAETGALKKITETLQVGGPAVDRFRYYSNPIDLDESLAPVPVAKGPLGPAGLMSARVKHQPVGVVACITPTTSRSPTWPARCAGARRRLHHRHQAGAAGPLGIFLLGEAIDAAGFPPGVVNIVNGAGPEVPAALVDTRNVDMISFTGSTGVARRSWRTAARP